MPEATRRFTSSNAVRGRPGWFYGLLVTSRGLDGRPDHLPTVKFDLYEPNGRRINGLLASGYRTTKLARRMGERELRGYEHEAHLAIRSEERPSHA